MNQTKKLLCCLAMLTARIYQLGTVVATAADTAREYAGDDGSDRSHKLLERAIEIVTKALEALEAAKSDLDKAIEEA